MKAPLLAASEPSDDSQDTDKKRDGMKTKKGTESCTEEYDSAADLPEWKRKGMKVKAPLLADSKPSDDSQDTDNNHYNVRVSLNNVYGVPKERRKTKCDCNKNLSEEKINVAV